MKSPPGNNQILSKSPKSSLEELANFFNFKLPGKECKGKTFDTIENTYMT